jgi:hypothetical protein
MVVRSRRSRFSGALSKIERENHQYPLNKFRTPFKQHKKVNCIENDLSRMDRSTIDSDYLKIQEALHRFGCGQNGNPIRSATGFSLETLSIPQPRRVSIDWAAMSIVLTSLLLRVGDLMLSLFSLSWPWRENGEGNRSKVLIAELMTKKILLFLQCFPLG